MKLMTFIFDPHRGSADPQRLADLAAALHFRQFAVIGEYHLVGAKEPAWGDRDQADLADAVLDRDPLAEFHYSNGKLRRRQEG